MAPITMSLSRLTNNLVTSDQLVRYQQTLLPADEPLSELFTTSLLTQAAGILLRLPQEVIATSIVILQRYLVVNVSDSRLRATAEEASAAAIYLCAKLSFYPLAPRSVINVYAYLTSKASVLQSLVPKGAPGEPEAKEYYVPEGVYEKSRIALFETEKQILTAVEFDTRTVLPHALALTYLQALGVSSQTLAERVFEYLNGALLSPQLLYLTHQPNEFAIAAVYLAAREVGTKLVNENWWEVFDVDREDLGFLVLAFGSLADFATAERQKWQTRSASNTTLK